MKILSKTVLAVIGLALGTGGSAGVFAKGHDAGVADGTWYDASIYSHGVVAGRDVRGVGDNPANFLGVAADLELDINYGDIVQRQVEEGTRRVVPVVNQPPREDGAD